MDDALLPRVLPPAAVRSLTAGSRPVAVVRRGHGRTPSPGRSGGLDLAGSALLACVTQDTGRRPVAPLLRSRDTGQPGRGLPRPRRGGPVHDPVHAHPAG